MELVRGYQGVRILGASSEDAALLVAQTSGKDRIVNCE
jgi:hypothetical protein